MTGRPSIPTRTAQTASYCLSFLIFGMGVAALGPALPSLAGHTGTSLSRISLVFATTAGGYLLGCLAGGRLFDRLPGHRALAAVLLGMGGVAALIPWAPSLWLITLLFLLFGFGEGVIEVGANTLLLWVHTDHAGPYLNALHFFFGVGALLAPVGIALATSASGSVAWFFWLFALAVLPVAAWLLALPSPARAGGSARAGRARGHIFPIVALVATFFVLYAGVEHGLGGWVSSYALALGMASGPAAAYLASAFWAALTAGRLLAVLASARFRPQAIVAVSLVGSLASVGVVLLWPSRAWVLWAGTLGLGLFLAAVVPTTLALASRRIGSTSQTTAWYFVGLATGKMSIPWAIGQFFDRFGPGSLFVALGLVLGGAVVLFAALATAGKPARAPASDGAA